MKNFTLYFLIGAWMFMFMYLSYHVVTIEQQLRELKQTVEVHNNILGDDVYAMEQ